MESEIIGKKMRFVLSNNFHYTGVVLDEDERTITILDQKNVRVSLSKFSIMIQEEAQINGY